MADREFFKPRVNHFLDKMRQCDGKQAYDKAAAAQQVAMRRKRERSSTLVAYECQWCHRYHVGHKRPGD